MGLQIVVGIAGVAPTGYRIAQAGEIYPQGYLWFDAFDNTWNAGDFRIGKKVPRECANEVAFPAQAQKPKAPRKAPKLQETSLKAHASQKDKAPSDCATILARIRKYRTGATCDKLEQVLGMSHQTTSARINDLVRKGGIRDSGRREKTRTGRLAICWKVVA